MRMIVFMLIFLTVSMAFADFQEQWQQIEKLEKEQKYAQAYDLAVKIYDQALKQGDDQQLTKSLVRAVLLKRAVHGYETAVKFLHEKEWPKSKKNKLVVQLFYTASLWDYYNQYSWEIGSREKVSSKKKLDLKKWTAQDIFEEINRQYTVLYQDKDLLFSLKVNDFTEKGHFFYIKPGNYPEKIRGTMLDFVCYRWIEFLANTSTWQPEQSKELYRMDFDALLAMPETRNALSEKDLAKKDVHPLTKIVGLTDALYYRHVDSKNISAALETQLVRVQQLHSRFSSPAQRTKTIASLKDMLKYYEQNPWWTMGQYLYATFLQNQDDLVAAHDAAEAGYRKFPKSFGGAKCRYLVASIESPNLQLQTMAVDRRGAKSLQIHHKNLSKVYFRAYEVDFFKWIGKKSRYLGSINSNEARDIVHKSKPVTSWKLSLQDLGDYKDHKTYITPKVPKDGYYLIAASIRKDFKAEKNYITCSYVLFSPMTITVNPLKKNWEVFVVDGTTGKGISGVKVRMLQHRYNKAHRQIEKQTTDSEGKAYFAYPRSGSYYFIAEKKKDFTFFPGYVYTPYEYNRNKNEGCYIYTDRSIYRPLQKVYFKLVTYQGNRKTGKYSCVPNKPAKMEFRDSNGKIIAQLKNLKTNEYGTTSGEFIIPKGRMLGQYSLRARVGHLRGYANFRVEEYKRPTFEVKLEKPKKPMRLNEAAVVQGKALYYFGLPVSEGKIFYRVTRAPVYPWWYGWYYSYLPSQTYEIAAGYAKLKPDGTFEIPFKPEADPAKKEVNYNYLIHVDVTDEGGETRSTSGSYPIGFVAVKADFAQPNGYFRYDDEIKVTVTRKDLSGVPQPGLGEYRLVRLEQPVKVMLPQDFPVKVDGKSTAGDKMRPRWEGTKTLQQYLYEFKDGKKVKSGALQHGKNGEAIPELGKLPAGAYRLYYNTKDYWGSDYQTRKEFIVADNYLKLSVPFFLQARSSKVKVGEIAELFLGSGIDDQAYLWEVYQGRKLLKRGWGKGSRIVRLPVEEKHRGGFTFRIISVHDYRLYQHSVTIHVPWDNKKLQLTFKRFRNTLRPGQKETWTVSIRGPQSEKVAAELLAYMYDRSLDIFATHNYPSFQNLLPSKYGLPGTRASFWSKYFSYIFSRNWYHMPPYVSSRLDHLAVFDNYPIGGPGRRYRWGHRLMAAEMAEEDAMPSKERAKNGNGEAPPEPNARIDTQAAAVVQQPKKDVPLRTNFNETAFFQPHLIVDENGEVSIEFQVPDSVTSWNVYLHALTKDLRFMTLKKEVVTRKELMVRPYLPRFLREGDQAIIKAVINNASEKAMSGTVMLTILDPETEEDKSALFGLKNTTLKWQADGNRSANVSWSIDVPKKVGSYAFKVVATSEDFSDGELRPVPVLPGRFHLMQSKFVTLKDNQTREIVIADLAKAEQDSSLVHGSLVVTLDAQLIYSVLKALPYLVDYPYGCVEQTFNRFFACGIASSMYDQYPAIQEMAKEFSKRKTQFEKWDKDDPNRNMLLEETPWLRAAEGGEDKNLINVLNPKIARAKRDEALTKLRKAQLSTGAFPWWPGGPSSPYMTLYLLHGFARAQEFGIEVPKDMSIKAWGYMGEYFRDYYEKKMLIEEYNYHFITFLNYVLSCYPEDSYGHAFTKKQRQAMLDYSWKNWKKHSPYLKGYLSLTLKRDNRDKDALLVLESIMDSAITKQDQGTFWAPEDRGWLWYNDTIESHAFILRALQEVDPKNQKHIDGLTLWMLLNKKLNHWKSTKTTAEVLYSLLYTMKRQGSLAVKETAAVTLGSQQHNFEFLPNRYTGDKQQIVVRGEHIDAKVMSKATVTKTGKGFMFASMTWHYSTEKLPEESRGDFLQVNRKYFLRKHQGKEYVLVPLAEGAQVKVGDQVEVHVSIRAKHPMEYVHLRAPRAAGFEPESQTSGHRWEFGIYWYEEIRDSGANYFFENLPQGEYNFRYRLRANMAGKFRVAPATLQSMYAPEFGAFSSGANIAIDK